ncbi:MAG: hypothetical protein EOL97_07175 [Spirochaetia bacterium]|nr:hypothetical protein [Spirochaetia bacterium]
MSAISDLVGTGGGILLTVAKAILIIALLVALFFGTKQINKLRFAKKNFKITAVISNPDGSHYTDLIGKFHDKDNLDKMMFKRNKTDTCPVINPKYIRNNSIHLFRYGPSEFAIIPPETYQAVNINDFGIKLIPINMLSFKGMEQRAAITRWQTKKDKLQQLLPWITIVLCIACALGAIYFVSEYAMESQAQATAARSQECSNLLSVETMSETITKVINTNLGIYDTNITTPV